MPSQQKLEANRRNAHKHGLAFRRAAPTLKMTEQSQIAPPPAPLPAAEVSSPL